MGKHEPDASDIDITVCVLAKHRLWQLYSIYHDVKALLGKRRLASEFVIAANGLESNEEQYLNDFTKGVAEKNTDIKIIRVQGNLDKAGSLRSVRNVIRGRVVVAVDSAGGKVIPEDITHLIDTLNSGYDLVNGARDWRGEPSVNKWQSKLFNWFTRRVAGTRLRDLNSTVKAFVPDVLDTVPLYGNFYRFLPILAEQKGFRVTEIPTKRREEQKKTTFYGPAAYIRRFLDILNLIFLSQFTEKPLRFFGGFGMAMLSAGFLLNCALVYERFVFRKEIADRPLLLLGILLMVMGVQVISIGLLGEMIVFSHSKEAGTYEVKEISS